MTMEIAEALDIMETMFPDARCELNYATTFQLAISVILSAQTTDISVNAITPELFSRYPDAKGMSQATQEDIESLIRRIGLYHNKARYILAFASELEKNYGGEVPSNRIQLTKLPGIGSKTANVIQAVGFAIPALAVDTHVDRVSHRLGWVDKNANVDQTEATLKKKIPIERWIKAHHSILFFGRYHCKAQKPACDICPLMSECVYYKEKSRNQQ
jgi:endonuclease-3